jgi:hypothetical protein
MTYGSQRLPIDIHKDNLKMISKMAGDLGATDSEILSMIIHHGCEALRTCSGLPKCPSNGFAPFPH